jgi:hypothetical protein
VSRTYQADLPEVLSLDENDPRRAEVEAVLYIAELAELRALWQRTRAAAAEARRLGDMARVLVLVRGTKTIQRIADERGVLFATEPRP